jgi:hypothetical protein
VSRDSVLGKAELSRYVVQRFPAQDGVLDIRQVRVTADRTDLGQSGLRFIVSLTERSIHKSLADSGSRASSARLLVIANHKIC